MATALSTYPISIYIGEEQGGQVAANTPGSIDLDSLTEGTDYILFESILRFEHKLTANWEGEEWMGHKTTGVGLGVTSETTGTVEKGYFMITVEGTETKAEYAEKLLKLKNRGSCATAANRIYLVKQTAASVYRQFPNASGTLKNYCQVILRGVDAVEISDSGKDVQLITLALEEVWSA